MCRICFIFILVSFSIFISCSSKGNENQFNQNETFEFHSKSSAEKSKSDNFFSSPNHELSKTINGFSYKVKYMSAIDFLQRKGEKIEDADINSLKKEQVILLEIVSDNVNKNILENKRLALEREEAINYLNNAIGQDFSVDQNDQSYAPNGVSFEGFYGENNKLRCVFFFSNIDLEKEFSITFYDRLFQAGLIKFKR